MSSTVSLAELIRCGVRLDVDEVMAVARQLIDAPDPSAEAESVEGPPTLESVFIGDDGSVHCRGCAVSATVSEIAALLDAVLRQGGCGKTPGGLRYAIARALLHDVDAPPFRSIADFSATIARYQRTPVQLSELFGRYLANAEPPTIALPDRRRTAPSATNFRRRLREADEELYNALRTGGGATPLPHVTSVESRPHVTSVESAEAREPQGTGEAHPLPPPAGAWRRSSPSRAIAAVVLAASLAFAVGYTVGRQGASWSVAVKREPATRGTAVDATSTAGRSTVKGRTSAANPSVADKAPDRDARRRQPASGELRRSDGDAPKERSEGVTSIGRPRVRAGDPVGTSQRVDAARGGEAASIVRAAGPANGPMFSPAFASNGSAFFFHTGRTADGQSALASADLTGDLRVMTILDDGAKNYHVQPSPDGSRVAFDSDRDGERGVYVANRDGTNVRRISGRGYAAVPTWSPDGSRLAFVRAEADRPRTWNLWVQQLDTGEMRRLTAFKYGQTWSASWFHDGRRIAYTHEDRLFIRDLDNSRTREFAAPVRGRLLRTPAVSPDGRHVIFQVARSGAWLLDLADGQMRCVLTDPTAEEFAWSPDGRRVAFHSRRDGQWGIWFLRPT